jgi:hypothetical protein
MTAPEENVTPGEHLDPAERDVEAPIADAYEQALPVSAEDEADAELEEQVHRGLEVSEYDAVEQAHTVPLDDDYR